MTDQNFEQMRRAMVDSQLRTTAVNDPRVVAAMSVVPREHYVPAAQAPLAYLDVPLQVAPDRFMMPPMVLGRLLTEARIRPSDRALVIGAGSGYSAATLAELASSVTALESNADLAGNVPVAKHVCRVSGPLVEGWAANAPYDLILLDGAVEYIPSAILDQLADGGRIAAPMVDNGITRLSIGHKAGGGFGMVSFADAEAPALPGFAVEKGFTF